MRTVLVDPFTDPRWDAFMQTHPEGTIYHHSAWARVLQESYGFAPEYYAMEEDGELKAAAPFCRVQSPLTGNRLICLPFSDCCFPLSQAPGEMKLLLDSVFREAARRRLALEVRGWGGVCRPEEFRMVGSPHFVVHRAYFNGSNGDLMDAIHPRARRGVKAAEKQQIVVRATTEYGDLEQFYRLNLETRRKLGILPQPWRFFQAIHRHLLTPGHGFLLIAETGKEMVAGVLYLQFQDTFTYKFNASSAAHLHLRPNHLLILKGMEMARRMGYRYFDFGRSDLESEGLREFKSQWGAEEHVLPYYYFPAIGGTSAETAGSLKHKVMALYTRHVPTPLLRITSAMLYRHLA